MHPRPDDFYLFTVLWFGVGGSLLALAGLWLETRQGRRSSRIFGGISFLAFSLLGVSLWLGGQPSGVVTPFLALALACLAVWAAHSVIVRWGAQQLLKPIVIWGLLLAVCPIFSLVYAYRLHRPDPLPPLLSEPGPKIHKGPGFPHGVTDSGRKIELFHYDEREDPETLDQLLVKDEDLLQKVIRVAGPDTVCNCHGWVFTGGQYGLASEDVDAILADNGYVVVDKAREGDVVIYRDDLGGVRHSGLVRFVGTDDLVLVESKWGPLGLYLHPPQDQPYGDLFHFYRTSRPGNNEVSLAPPTKRRRNSAPRVRRGVA
jgi:hypothetical protein